MSIKHIRTTAPVEYHDFLIPKYPFACKRVILDGGYLKCLNQPNVELVYDPIKEITAKGVVCASGREHEVDVLILGTGFDLVSRSIWEGPCVSVDQCYRVRGSWDWTSMVLQAALSGTNGTYRKGHRPTLTCEMAYLYCRSTRN